MSPTIPGNAAGLFSQFLDALRDEGHHIPVSDYRAAELVAAGLGSLFGDGDAETEDDEAAAEACGYLSNSFYSVAADLRDDTDEGQGGPECGHSACSQHYIDTGSRECVEDEP